MLTLSIDENDLPDGLPVELSGTIMKGADNKLFAWYGGGREQVHIPVKVVVEKTLEPLDTSEPGCADCGSNPAKCDCGKHEGVSD